MSDPEVIVDYEKLITAQVKVQDENGNLFYLDPARKQGEFILRVVPQPVSDEVEELPAEWVKPPKSDTPEGIDWGFKPDSNPFAEADVVVDPAVITEVEIEVDAHSEAVVDETNVPTDVETEANAPSDDEAVG